MDVIYLCIVIFLLCLAVFDLFVGVSNDAVNFLQSAIGSKAATFRMVIIIASAGILLGAVMSSGMMDVARHVIMVPANYSFSEVMTIFLAVMVTDVIVLDAFNSMGMPTSTTVSLVFELLGGTFCLAVIKMTGDPSLSFPDLLNADKALQVIIAIFVSVAISFVVGVVVMWISRVVFTFNYTSHSRYSVALFGGVAFTALAYFIFLKGIAKSPYIPSATFAWIDAHTSMLIGVCFVGSTLLMELMHLVGINVFRFVVLMGTFALAMAFAGNDLVNFIGVPLAGLDSYLDFTANGAGAGPSQFMMTSLMDSAKTPPLILLTAGVIMIVAMSTSRKAQNVVKTSVDLSRQDEGEQMFGSSMAARAIVRLAQNVSDEADREASKVKALGKLRVWIDRRFDRSGVALRNGAAFDMVRAAVNLVIAAMLITIGTNYKLPLSTTYVTFMVAMGASLADRAWSRESAVFRVTGVLSVIGGWFLTAGAAFIACATVCLAMHYGGVVVQVAFIALVIYALVSSNRKFKRKEASDNEASLFQTMMRTHDATLVWDMLRSHVRQTQSSSAQFASAEYARIVDGLFENKPHLLRQASHDLRDQKERLKKYRRQEIVALRRIPANIAVERNTWFHVGINASLQYVYCLVRMLEPIKEHVDNNFTPLPVELRDEYAPCRLRIDQLLRETEAEISTGRFENYRETLAEADALKNELSQVRHRQINRMQSESSAAGLQASLVYLNLLQESQQLLSNMRHQLRAAKKFMEG